MNTFYGNKLHLDQPRQGNTLGTRLHLDQRFIYEVFGSVQKFFKLHSLPETDDKKVNDDILHFNLRHNIAVVG